MTLAGSQSEGCRLPTDGRRVTTGTAGGGRLTKQKTDVEGEIGGEREYARANCTGRQGTRVNLGGGRGGIRAIF